MLDMKAGQSGRVAKADKAGAAAAYEIEAKTSLSDRVLRNLKHGDAFAVVDAHGDIGTVDDSAEGLYYRDTRFLSHLELRLEGKRPLLLSSAIHEDKAALSVELTNPDLDIGQKRLQRDTIFIHRTKFLWQGTCYERINVRNYGQTAERLRIDLFFDADFHDLFEVRGTPRKARGKSTARVTSDRQVEFRYAGLDQVERVTLLEMSPPPAAIEPHRATIDVELGRHQQCSFFFIVSCVDSAVTQPPPATFLTAYRDTRRMRRTVTAGIATVASTAGAFQDVLTRAASDVYTLVTWGPNGPYPYAGIPWFSTVFGRDGIITAIMMLWVDPTIAAGVLRTLAATQATSIDPYADAEPGKILHEMRHGEMANLGEVPFSRYYGAIDATPLFVVLAGLYLERTGDLKTIESLWPNITAALRWMDEYGDPDRDGFLEYARRRDSGLANQGWKDSYDAIFHADGSNAPGPIALCEVQGYAFAARFKAAAMARALGRTEVALELEAAAEELRARFEQAFWCEEIGTYALALDGEKRQCQVRASNAGHALFSGIASPERAARVASGLLAPELFSGWGIRTLGKREARFNPMSYHNGSVWPHDNALIALGFARYGFKAAAGEILASISAAAMQQDLQRLPELFCGFDRRPNRAPTPYPVACAPQAWSAAAMFGLLAACLGLELSHERNEIQFHEPWMPELLEDLVIRGLRLGSSSADVRLHRHGSDVAMNVLAREGDARIVMSK
jgi:glycogen debranching enzyme